MFTKSWLALAIILCGIMAFGVTTCVKVGESEAHFYGANKRVSPPFYSSREGKVASKT